MHGFVAVCLPLTIGLGVWQLDRADVKRGLEAAYFERMASEPRPPGPATEPFERLRLVGRFGKRHFLVDNQVHEGRAGYWVVSGFLTGDGRRFLVNRGWLAAPLHRDELPEVRSPPGVASVTGTVWPDTGLPPLLAEDRWPAGWPKRVQRLNVDRMGGLLEAERFEVRLDSGQPGALAPIASVARFAPDRHTGYAVQWFGLGSVLLIGYIVVWIKGKDRGTIDGG